jgi:hypothetical protein
MTKRFKFEDFVSPGDTASVDLGDGWEAHATIEYDHDSTPDGRNLDDAAAVKAWQDDEWFYCGVCVSVSRDGVMLSDKYANALWGVEANFPAPDSNAYLGEVADRHIRAALTDAKAKLVRLARADEERIGIGLVNGQIREMKA